MGPRFAAAGYCTYALTYGQLPGIPLFAGLDKMENSAPQLASFIDQVLASTNATQVDLVGHSQGSLMPRYYLKFLGGASKVRMYSAHLHDLFEKTWNSNHVQALTFRFLMYHYQVNTEPLVPLSPELLWMDSTPSSPLLDSTIPCMENSYAWGC